MRPEQPTVPDRPSPDPRSAMAALLASTQAQEQAAAVLREAGWTVREPASVAWFSTFDNYHHAIRDEEIVGMVAEYDGLFYPATSDGGSFDMAFHTAAEARSAVETALKGGAK